MMCSNLKLMIGLEMSLVRHGTGLLGVDKIR